MVVYPSTFPPVSLPRNSVYTHLIAPNHFAQDFPAFIDATTDHVVTRAVVKEQSEKLALGLRNLHRIGGVEPKRGSTATVISHNTVLYPIVMLACAAAGIRAAFANSAYTDTELAHVLKNSGSSHVLVHFDSLPVTISALALIGISQEEAKKRVVIIAPRHTTPAEILQAGWLSCDDLVSGETTLPEDFSEERSEETVFIYYSSGTTGLSKGVELSHFNITSVIEQCCATWTGFKHGRDVNLGLLPFYHVFGGVIVALISYAAGIPVVVLPKFNPALLLSSIAKHQVTVAMIVPPVLRFLAKHPLVEDFDVSSLRTILVGAAASSPMLMEEARQRLDSRGAQIAMMQGLGLTETCGSTFFSPVELAKNKDRYSTVGLLVTNMEARLVDDDGEDVPECTPGELWLRGPNVMKGYIGVSGSGGAITEERWLKTGDILTRDRTGFFTVIDRKKELIKYKGFQVPPAELEVILAAHPDIVDAGVVGVYSEEDATELPKAFIVPRDIFLLKHDDQCDFITGIHEWLNTRVAHHKRLRGGIVLIESIPRSAAGKILRRNLKDLPSK
ncbi:AMP binding protein [Ramaria rubella]|nr:AMP binding protein [Ramaria rubella]